MQKNALFLLKNCKNRPEAPWAPLRPAAVAALFLVTPLIPGQGKR